MDQSLLNMLPSAKLLPKGRHLEDGVQQVYDVDVRVGSWTWLSLLRMFTSWLVQVPMAGLLCATLVKVQMHKTIRRLLQRVSGVVAVQFTGGEGESEYAHPRVCWHCHKREVLIVGIGNNVLKIDITKVERDSEGEPLSCSFDKLIDGVQLVGSHDGQVTDLSMCHSMTTTRLVSASVDGTIKIWEDQKSLPIAVLRPYDGQPVNSVTFVPAPDRPDHIILITGGPLNREVKIWVSASDEGWLLPSDAKSWNCTQTLEFKSSMGRSDEAFFNQVIALSQAGLLLLANAKRNAIYAVHLEYGPNPAATRMDYIAEFTVTTPILSFSGTSELLPHGEQIVKVYCVQTQAIQQYALDLSQCVPSLMQEIAETERNG
ncbi:hypothetical protein BUALT_Bualt18G0084500 [Buddleja alternifolia]|uniref:Enhancer of mRNA-decapping protein 4 WD40 repeat region domain-containing protein n=1 Tax=Buddleja alternifolia TaxID=168488 RepID=A0AAV6W421_9LAMI|nr:hypothetical protein BUALT_Bualt18G0084500 [Buddleja alternifolia]